MALPQVTPVWVAATAYLIGARVTATTPDGLDWYCTVAGTSGIAEPTWPTAEPWTVVDGTVTWRLATSFRQLVSRGIVDALTAFKAANPWAIKGILSSRPRSLSNLSLPGVYVDDMNETVVHTVGVRQRTFTGCTVTLVMQVPDNVQAAAAADTIVDALMDMFTAAYHAADGTSILQVTSVEEVTIDDGGPKYLANIFTLGATVKAEGRI